MFGWFSKKKKNERRSRDLVWISKEAQWKALPILLIENQPAFVYAWFSSTVERAKSVVADANLNIRIQYASDFSDVATSGATVIVLEHYPLLHKEEWILNAVYPREILVLSGLDEPLFNLFGGQRITEIMQKMGMDESEKIEHSMINSSILRAQQKISEKVSSDFSARSQEEWFRYSGLQNQE
jgi:preprotein translocase subunit SecA